ncbi:MAG: hypothetical protein PVJ51_00300 [Acidobacteriota bacterium]|jgi:hypothetical protein
MIRGVAAMLAAGVVVMVALAAPGAGIATPRQADTVELSFFDLTTHAPASWVRQEPSSSMRLLQMTVPGDGDADAELVVFFFGQGQGGDVEANVERWRSQFSRPDGNAVVPSIERFEVAGMPVTVAELTGTYRRGMGGGTGDPEPDQTLAAGIVETGRGTLFIQMHGPSATVAAQHDAFEAFLRGLRPSGNSGRDR